LKRFLFLKVLRVYPPQAESALQAEGRRFPARLRRAGREWSTPTDLKSASMIEALFCF